MNKKLYTLYFILLPIPLFFTTSLSIFREEVIQHRGAGTELLNVGFLFALILVTIKLNKSVGSLFKKNSLPLLTFGLIAFFSFCIQVLIGNSNGNPLLLMISIIPLILNYMVGFLFRDLIYVDQKFLNYIINKVTIVFACVIFAHISYSLVKLGLVSSFYWRGADSIWGLFSIHQKMVYFPTIVAIVFILSLFSTSKYKKVVMGILFFEIVMNFSREGVLLIFLGLCARVYYLFRYENKKIIVFLYIILGVIFAYLLFQYIVTNFENSSFADKLLSIQEKGHYSAGRFEQIKEGFEEMLNPETHYSLLIGTGFAMNLGFLGTPHNQYIEILFRGGILGLLTFIFSICNTLFLIKKQLKFYKKTKNQCCHIFFSFAVIFVLLTCVSFNINTPIRSMYACGLYGFLMGFLNNSRRIGG
ncbi:O-antigen ligase family protein [Pasteurella skyensis]|uniref:O-antigen ligase family protein n=1 Tax=Phocoenobacter skyensis TaxID=97481 RepID=A0AAJ6NA65_9PAST|nr:O-antigen ligase family protein [Pasteurella skyensis]MDP8162127.1 O-antigen ligase family protein [Pasteurella skyensis]MDP8172986.1 O-antigen ligase family protein [Pasteurella skyensis]MDP8176753.1 O-antigen ligase family protein [Pasteurella skyensis]MDP8179489.1 O-antigen ligase family protein [Pasteurella skyensis]MDP8183657.1 O-antigen ligase family protein [Pasteurella skyensis]